MTQPYKPAGGGGGGPASTDPFGTVEGIGTGGLFGGGGRQIVTGDTGSTPGGYLLQGLNAKGGQASSSVASSSDELLHQLFTMSKDEVKALQAKLIAAGNSSVTVNGVPDNATLNAYSNILNYASLYQAANPNSPNKFTPNEILDSLAQARKGGDKTSTSTSTDVTLTNPLQARQALQTAFSDKLGRKPTDSEAAAFLSGLHAYESSNPSTSTTTTDTSTDPTGVQSIKSQNTQTTDKGTGSLNFVNDFAAQHVQSDPGTSAEYQAAQHLDFYNLALQALTGGGISTGNTD